MSGFIAIAPAVDKSTVLRNSGFFPDIDLKVLRDTVRLDNTVTEARIDHSAVSAMASVNRELRDWRVEQQAAGYRNLEAVPAEHIDGTSELVTLYLRAVYSLVEATIRERYRDFDTTADGHKHADAQESPIDDLKRDARWAIRDLLGRTHTTVELI